MSCAWIPEIQDKEFKPKKDWLENHEELLREQASLEKVDVLFLGDSITQGWRWPTSGKASWDEHFADLNPLNLGIGGDEVQHQLWRLQNGEARGLSPKVIVILIGTNNIGNVGHPAADVARGIGVLLEEVQAMMPDAVILLHKIFPRGEDPNDPFRIEVDKTNELIMSYADGDRVLLLDFNDLFLEPDASISSKVMPDFLHLSVDAYETWAKALKPEVLKRLS